MVVLRVRSQWRTKWKIRSKREKKILWTSVCKWKKMGKKEFQKRRGAKKHRRKKLGWFVRMGKKLNVYSGKKVWREARKLAQGGKRGKDSVHTKERGRVNRRASLVEDNS